MTSTPTTRIGAAASEGRSGELVLNSDQTQNSAGAAEVRVLCEVHDIVIPPIPCSFTWKMHPAVEHLMEMSDAWMVANFGNMPGADGRPLSFLPERLKKSAFHLLVALTYANAQSDRLGPIAKMMIWVFMMDNILDDPSEMGADPYRTDVLIDTVLSSVFHRNYVSPCACPIPLTRILTETGAEWWAEMCVAMPPMQKARFIQAFADYMEATRVQTNYRNSRRLPNLETYFKTRSYSIGWRPLAVLIEYSLGFELDNETLSHPVLISLQEQIVQHIFLLNDVASCPKEFLEGDFCNIVSLLYFQKLSAPELAEKSLQGAEAATILQRAVTEAMEMAKDRDEECVRLFAQLKGDGKLMQKQGMVEYLDGLGLWLSGHAYWILVSGRYGQICATPDIHTSPPDMLASHHIKIPASSLVSHMLPQGL